jgi:hypothetical protein
MSDTQRCGAKTRNGNCKLPAGHGTNHVGQGRCKLHGGNNPVKHGRYSKINRPRIRELLDEFEEQGDELNLVPELHMLRALITDYIERYDAQTEALIAWHESTGVGFLDAKERYTIAYDKWLVDYEVWQKSWEEYRDQVIATQEHYRYGWTEPPEVAVMPMPPTPPQPADYANKPRQVVDILDVAKFIGQIGTLAERIEKQRQEGSITMATLDRVLEQIGVEIVQAAQETVTDATTRQSLLECVERRIGTIAIETGGKKR